MIWVRYAHAPPLAEGDLPPGRQETSRKPKKSIKNIVKTDTLSAHAPPPAEGDLPPGRQETSRKAKEKQKSILKTDTNTAHAPPPAEGDLPPGKQETSRKAGGSIGKATQYLGVRIRIRKSDTVLRIQV